MSESPTEIHAPRLESVSVRQERHRGTIVEMRISTPMHGHVYTIRCRNPHFHQTADESVCTEQDIRACFAESCTLLSVFADRGTIEFQGSDSFRRIRGTDLELA